MKNSYAGEKKNCILHYYTLLDWYFVLHSLYVVDWLSAIQHSSNYITYQTVERAKWNKKCRTKLYSRIFFSGIGGGGSLNENQRTDIWMFITLRTVRV